MIRREGVVNGFSIALGAVLLLILFYLGWRLLQAVGNIIMPFVVALIFALLLNPLVIRVERTWFRGRRGPAVGVVFLGFLLVFVGLIAFLVPNLIEQTSRLVRFFSPVTYRVERAPARGGLWIEAANDLTVTNYTVKNLDNGVRYQFRVTARDADGKPFVLRPVAAIPAVPVAPQVGGRERRSLLEERGRDDAAATPQPTVSPAPTSSPEAVASPIRGATPTPRRPGAFDTSADPTPPPTAAPSPAPGDAEPTEATEPTPSPSASPQEESPLLPTPEPTPSASPGTEEPSGEPTPVAGETGAEGTPSPSPSPSPSAGEDDEPTPTPSPRTAASGEPTPEPRATPAPARSSAQTDRQAVSDEPRRVSGGTTLRGAPQSPASIEPGTVAAYPGDGQVRLFWKPPSQVQSRFEQLRAEVDAWLLSHRKIGPISLPPDIATLQAQYSTQLSRALQEGSRRIAGVIVGSVSTLLIVIVIPILTFYILNDLERLRARFLMLLPERIREHFRDSAEDVGEVFGNYLRGMFTMALLYGVVTMILFFLFDLRAYALLLGFVAGVLYPVPFIGPLFTTFLGAVVSLMTGHGLPHALLIIGVVQGTNLVFDNVLVPRVVGKEVGLHPLTTVFALFLGSELFGLWGMLFSVPLAASIQQVLYRLFPSLKAPTPLSLMMPGKRVDRSTNGTNGEGSEPTKTD
jgi:predicted PurR-regulated permease PerM